MTTMPSLNQISHILSQAPPIEMAIEPFRCFVLVSQLQLALRHPDNTGSSADIARDMAMRLQAKLGHLDPAIALALESGWHPEFDMTRDEADTYFEGEDELHG